MTYTVEFTGMDRSSNEESCESLEEAKELKIFLEERGCHGIYIIDDDTEEEA